MRKGFGWHINNVSVVDAGQLCLANCSDLTKRSWCATAPTVKIPDCRPLFHRCCALGRT